VRTFLMDRDRGDPGTDEGHVRKRLGPRVGEWWLPGTESGRRGGMCVQNGCDQFRYTKRRRDPAFRFPILESERMKVCPYCQAL